MELYSSFEPVLYQQPAVRYVVRYFKMNQRKTAKTFSLKKYGSEEAAEEAAWKFFFECFPSLIGN